MYTKQKIIVDRAFAKYIHSFEFVLLISFFFFFFSSRLFVCVIFALHLFRCIYLSQVPATNVQRIFTTFRQRWPNFSNGKRIFFVFFPVFPSLYRMRHNSFLLNWDYCLFDCCFVQFIFCSAILCERLPACLPAVAYICA